jgi:hypothetical protein
MRKIQIRLTPRVIAFLVILSLAASVFSVPRDSTMDAVVSSNPVTETWVEDEAVAGDFTYNKQCTIPSDISDGLGGKSGVGRSDYSENSAIATAYNKAAKKVSSRWRAVYDKWSGEVSLQRSNGKKGKKIRWTEHYAFDGPSHCANYER